MTKQLLSILAIAFTTSAFAQWNTNTAINTPVTIANKAQDNIHAIPDNKRGMILAWDDNRNNATNSTDIYAQRLRNNGLVKWATGGVVICGNSFVQKSSAITESDNGSAIITWEDNRNGNYDIYAQKIDSSGNVLWAADGIAVCSKANHQKNPKIVSDNAGGAVVVWEDSASFYFDVFAQRINALGVTQWASNGVALCTAPNNQVNPKIDTDGAGGAIVTWQDKRNNSDYDIYAQAVNAAGTVQWTANGLVVCNAVNVQNNPRIEPDGNGGAYIVWVDKRNATNVDIYAQRLNASGIAQWTSNGVVVCNASNNQSAHDIKNIGAGGLAISWKDDRSGKFEIYTQVLNPSGVAQQTANGILLSNLASLRSINPNTVVDGQGGCIIVWQDSIATGFNIHSQKINNTGVPQWAVGGVTISSAASDQINATLVSDGLGGAVYAWEDKRNGDYDIYAHRLFSNGLPTVGIFEIENTNAFDVICFPNPINQNSIIKPNNVNSNWVISVYDCTGKLIDKQFVNKNNHYQIPTAQLSSGVYFYSVYLTDTNSLSRGRFVYNK